MTDQAETSRKRRPDERPAEILTAALDLFTERGFSATRLEDVAQRAGLSKAAIYLYFKDKTSLLTALVESVAAPNVALAADLIRNHQGPVAPLVGQIMILLAGRLTATRMPDLVKLIISESRAYPELGRFYLDNVIGRALPLFRDLLERGIANGEFRAIDTDLAVKCMVGPMLLGAIWKSVFEPIGAAPIDIAALARLDADLMLRGLKP
ncbi:MAG: TetR/AcrR family transcriptional regulator [Rhizobiales bacterium]|nr:TetR/AcrR family transcriptional regulator [Hyphomicrobiales bacterium]MBI3672327.1 TetR/AcrR family transcriptional regulator [Hyphomicrobiales bacterium]